MADIADGTRIGSSPSLFQLINDLHTAHFGDSGNSAARKRGPDHIKAVHSFCKLSPDIGYDMDNMRVLLGCHQLIYMHAAIVADLAHIIALKVNEHDMLCPFFFIQQKLCLHLIVPLQILSSRPRAGNRTCINSPAVYANKSFR